MSDLPPLAPDTGMAEPDMAAAELALGVLAGEERALAVRRVLAEPGFARSVEQWRGHLAQLFDLWPAIEPRDIFARIERSLDAPVASLAVLPRPAASKLWPGLAALSSVAAAGLLVVLVTRPVPTPPAPAPRPTVATIAPTASPVLVAAIAPDKGATVTAVYDPAGGALRLTEAALADANRTAQLWVIAGDGVPHSLGLLPAHGASRFTVPAGDRARLAAGALLAVSLEPVGGSPTGLPTGPVVAKGALSLV